MTGVWFRKCLRLHDNEALAQAVAAGGAVVPFFVLDPAFDRSRIGVNRYAFLLECLADLDKQLREQYRSRLLVLQGTPEVIFRQLFDATGPFQLKSVFWEKDSEPYAKIRDGKIERLAKEFGVQTRSFLGHTILDLEAVIKKPGFKAPISMRDIQKLIDSNGPIPPPQPVAKIPPLKLEGHEVPLITELYEEAPTKHFPGGESEALRRLERVCSDVNYVCNFEKPKTSSTGQLGKPWDPSTTGLSPYFKFGCLSVRTAWHAIAKCQHGRRHAQPPQSLHGQLLFREMFYILSVSTPNWDKDQENPMCKVIPWGNDENLLSAWEEGKTGYPFIDALMRQLRQTGWMHHLGRHAVACFLTRGDLWQHWTKGRDIFDKYLLDADWALNNGNWLWLAGVAPFSSPYFRVYDPSPGPKSSLNAEQAGDFVRHFVPELAKMPSKYIYKPWTAPLHVQQQAKCIIGKDYPARVVDHQIVREENIQRFGDSLKALKTGQMPAKFGGATEDPGAMKSRYTTAASSHAPNKEPNSSQTASDTQPCKRPTASNSGPQPKRRWSRKVEQSDSTQTTLLFEKCAGS
mmetsp:Transcript_64063/g.111664  ORF Transcript_64063/g.111664 Transcript_64063/m.111664 type:complete len:573 (+) Transcript_64063:37-1755(+)